MEIRTIPNFLKMRDVGPIVESRKPLASFISANVERDEDGSFRIPSAFMEQFGGKLYYHLFIKCNNILWTAIFDKKMNKICGLYDFLTYYDLRMYSVVVFDYFGRGNFSVKTYKHTATSMINPTIDPDQFFKNDKSRHLRMDQFVYGRNKLEVEKYIGMVSYNAAKNDTDVFKIQVNEEGKRQKWKYLKLKKDLEDLYKNWKEMDTIFLTLGMMMWKIEVHWDGGSCKFGNGWSKFLKELNISTGDVITLNIAETPDVVLICIFKKEELDFEKEEGMRDGRRSFYKILLEPTLKHGYVVLPALIGVETERSLSSIKNILIYGMEWEIGYNAKFRIIYGLEKVIKHFSLAAFDTLHFSFQMDGVLCGRIFKSDGMEIIYSTSEKNIALEKSEYCFIFEESHRDRKLDSEYTKLMDVVTHEAIRTNNVILHNSMKSVPPDDIDHAIPDAMEIVEPDLIEIAENAVEYQFSKRLIGCNMNGRCHGMHIPTNIKIGNRDWKKGDGVIFRTAERTWNITIVLNNGKARFSGGWSRFVKDEQLKLNDNLRFTLREEAGSFIFDVEVNPTD